MNYAALRYFNVDGPRRDAFGVYTEVMIRWMKQLADTKKAGHLLGFRAHMPLEEGPTRLVQRWSKERAAQPAVA
jgi:nucleoside-diphosphate-sugar epimerase